MVQTLQANDLTLYDVEKKFSLKATDDIQFFREWLDGLPELTDIERQSLDRVKANYLHLSKHLMPEGIVKMVMLSPLLDLAGFYRSPFRVTAEMPVQISAEDEGEILRGRIDVLVMQDQFWVLVIESKRNTFSLEPGMPQALAYMMGNPDPDRPTFGLVTNGSNFIFIKLLKQDTPRYALSDEFTLRRGGDLYGVLSVLKRLGSEVLLD